MKSSDPFLPDIAQVAGRLGADMLLSKEQIDRALPGLPGWTSDGKALWRTFEFRGFVEAVAFVDSLVAPAEALHHHPDIAIAYNRVTLSLTTHDAGGLTAKDLALAAAIEKLRVSE